MQQTQATEPAKRERPIDERITLAQAQLEKLKQAAVDADAEAERWRIAFEREPTADSYANSTIWAQKAKNAHAATQQHEAEVLSTLVAEKREAERKVVRAELDRQTDSAVAAFEAAGELVIDAVRALDAAIAELAALHTPRIRAQRAGVGLPAVSLEPLLRQINDKLAPFRGTNGFNQLTDDARIYYTPGGGTDGRVVLSITRPAMVVPLLLR